MNLDNLQTFQSLFSQWRFTVPDYQRGYAWGTDQWIALIEDLATLTDDNDHFTGLLVLHENKAPEVRVKTFGIIKDVYDIVDGQQRMTTIVILLNEIRRAMDELGCGDLPQIVHSIQETYLCESGPGGIPVLKLNLDRLNQDFFTHNVLEIDGVNLKGAEIQSHRNLIDGRSFFRDYLAKKKLELGDGYAAWLETLYSKIANQMKIMVYRLRSEADAGVVFESMNNRGKKPNHLDLVKNYLLFLSSKLGPDLNPKLSREINTTWETIFRQLSAIEQHQKIEESLLQMHWFAVYDHNKKNWDKVTEKSDLIKRRFPLVKYIGCYDQLYQELMHYIQTLRNAAVAYADLHQPDRPDAFQIYAGTPDIRVEIIKHSQKLNRLNNMRPFQPLLIAARLKEPTNGDQYLRLLRLCEQYSFRVFSIAVSKSSSKENLLFRLGNQYYNDRVSFALMEETLRRDLFKECSDKLFKASFSLENPKSWLDKSCLAYFLYEYEEELSRPNAPMINWQSIYDGRTKSIEHILPQNPQKDGYWVMHFTEEERQRFTDQVGNLTLILAGWNSSLGNKPFPEKKGVQGRIVQDQGGQKQPEPCYANSDLKITNRLAALKDWTPKELAKRQQDLAEWALLRWHVDPPPPLPADPFEALKRNAEANGFGAEFIKIHQAAQRLRLYPKPNKQCMSYKSPHNHTRSALKYYTYASGISISMVFSNFPKYHGVPEKRVREVFENTAAWWLPQEKVAGFIRSLEQLAHEIESQGGK
jgi:hypothetical protein